MSRARSPRKSPMARCTASCQAGLRAARASVRGSGLAPPRGSAPWPQYARRRTGRPRPRKMGPACRRCGGAAQRSAVRDPPPRRGRRPASRIRRHHAQAADVRCSRAAGARRRGAAGVLAPPEENALTLPRGAAPQRPTPRCQRLEQVIDRLVTDAEAQLRDHHLDAAATRRQARAIGRITHASRFSPPDRRGASARCSARRSAPPPAAMSVPRWR